ncbi:MAG TPA: WYL domain-containing protein [Acidimicrobiales bacterium]|nr:WYL domain-containing protein [Acidimicrobiales bacterium]
MAEDRFERLTNLVTFLLDSRHGATYAEIVEAIPGYPPGAEARRRAFERDKKLLRDEDIPLVEEENRYRIPPEDYFLPDLGLSGEEQLALELATTAVPVGADQGRWALRKLALGGAGSVTGEAGPTVLAHLDEHPLLPELHAAIRRRAVVRFTHSGATRTVEPELLFFRAGHWYLHGFDRVREAVRNFRLDRVEAPLEVGEPGGFEPRPGRPTGGAEVMPREPWRLGGDEPELATVRVDAVLAAKAEADAGPSATVDRHADGSVTVTLPVSLRGAFLSWVLGFLDHAEVLAPPDLRAETVAWLAAVAEAGG